MKIIKFSYIGDPIPDIYRPVPASSMLPEWYKKADSYLNKVKQPMNNGLSVSTIKKCIPVFDAITSGYLIVTHHDINIQWDGYQYSFMSTHNNDSISYHEGWQAQNHPHLDKSIGVMFKFKNRWTMKTPSGYSIAIIPPMHRDNIISILPAIVDSDTYTHTVEMPFEISVDNFSGIIPAGTPIAQIIPFKRDNWKSQFVNSISSSEKVAAAVRSTFFEGYKKLFWSRKSYK
jgi:hypothetical protein